MVCIPGAVGTVIAQPGEQTFRVIGIAFANEINDPQRIVSLFAPVRVLTFHGRAFRGNLQLVELQMRKWLEFDRPDFGLMRIELELAFGF